MIVLPEMPATPRAIAEVPLRFEDVTQDGRVRLGVFSHALGEAVWKKELSTHPANQALREQGVVPILSRLVLEGEGGPFAVASPLTATGTFQLSHTASATGEVERLLLRMWVELTAPTGRTHGPAPDDAGRPMRVGRAFAEHVLTRPFGPPEERKVLRVDAPGLPPVPPQRSSWTPAPEVSRLPDGATLLERSASPDPAPCVFGIAHTDSNFHVNSLVYPRLFEEAVLRRLSALGRDPAMLSRALEIAYRKPFFAGDRASVMLQTFDLAGRLGAVGTFAGDDNARPRVHVSMYFDR